ncbi:MAG: glycosyltransferase [Proteobacteria bacterium]|nr:glycosyltransferase [Pseudomonadota bacterium]NIS69485.1 glycosyltransferase [Pseudomonadota bacterium]
MKYNIALLHYTCPPFVGGVEEIIGQQALLFNRYYHRAKVFVGAGARFSGACEVEINPLLGSRSRRVLNAQRLGFEGNPKKMEALTGEIYGYLVESLRGFDILIAHNILAMPFNLPLTAAVHRMGQESLIPIISWNHDSPYFYLGYPKYLDLFPWNILKRAYAGIHYVVVSESRKAMFESLYGKRQRISVIPNGIDPVQFFRLDPATVRLIQEQRLFEAEFLMVQPSRLHPRKNMELSIRVTKALHDLGIRARLLITGAHDPHQPKTMHYYNKLTDLSRELGLEKDVLIMAEYSFESGEKLSVDQITIRDFYLIADILFLPSLQEGFGIPLLESGMIKLPIVCSNIPPFVEIGGEEVCVFGPDDPPQKIAKKILAFVGEMKTQKMFRKVIRHYAWDNIYHNELMPLLTRVVASR